MTTSFDSMLVAAWRGRTAAEILDAPPSALAGVSQGDADKLEAAFGVKTVRDLAELKFARRARAVLASEGTPGFDPGPSPEWEEFWATAPLAHYEAHPAGRFRLDFGPVYYRGRLDGSARALIVGQDPSTNEILAQRVFVGRSGQRLQGLLRKLGLTRSYVMVNTFVYSVFDTFDNELRAISLEPPVLGFRNSLLDRLAAGNPLQAVITIGSGARHAVENWPGVGALPVFELVHPAAPEAMVLASWNAALPGLMAALDPDDDGVVDPAPYGAAFVPADEAAIPRFDLPFGIPEWHGAGPQTSHRDGNKNIIWTAP